MFESWFCPKRKVHPWMVRIDGLKWDDSCVWRGNESGNGFVRWGDVDVDERVSNYYLQVRKKLARKELTNMMSEKWGGMG